MRLPSTAVLAVAAVSGPCRDRAVPSERPKVSRHVLCRLSLVPPTAYETFDHDAWDAFAAEMCARLRRNCHDAEAWKGLGVARTEQGEWGEAESVYRTAMKLFPGEPLFAAEEAIHRAFAVDAMPEPEHVPSTHRFESFDAGFLAGAMPTGFTDTHLVHASLEPLFSAEACASLVAAAERHAAEHGWNTDRHPHAPTIDVPVAAIEEASAWLREQMHGTLLPALAALFPRHGALGEIDHRRLRVQDAIVVRYDGDARNGPGQCELQAHVDDSLFSFTIPLNDRDAYEGGGVRFKCLQQAGAAGGGTTGTVVEGGVVNRDAGHVIAFAGGLEHAGHPISAGTRYILAVFVYCALNESGRETGYSLAAVEGGASEGCV